ncbi:MAG: HpcH/HpaI aldolase family protein [Fluviicola sp.]|jgi:4-hydroxy-2-oxoheptanedioate aldolase
MIGFFSKTTDSSFIEAAGHAGLDFAIIDQEHGLASREAILHHTRAAKLGGLKAIVRVAELNHNLIGAALDQGADGVQIPNITTAEEAEKAIQAARFYPLGMRGVCRFVPAANHGTKDKNRYFADENQKLVILQVEGVEGIKNIDSILSLEGFDILFIGPYDLSQSLGIPGEIEHPTLLKTISDLVLKAKEKNKLIGTFVDTKKAIKNMQDQGIDYIAYSVDVNIYHDACKSIRETYDD